jgi:transglutaminase-like putative cysteine protease
MSSQLKLSAYGALATMTASVSLLSVFSSTVWMMPVMVSIAVVAATCAIVRASPLPSAFEPVLAAVGVLVWVTVLDARSEAHAGFIPGRLAFRHLGHVARHGFTEIHRLPTPAPAHTGLVLLTIIGVSAIALVVDLLTVTLRRAALAGLPLLALFTVGAATGHNGVGIVAFVIAATGYLWLLYADNRDKVARWGAAVGTGKRARPASAWSTDPSSAPAPAALGRQVGAVAIGLGVLVPVLIPGLHTGIAKNHGSGGSGTGGSGTGGNVQTFNPIVKIGADLASSVSKPVLTYRSSAPSPGYLRLTSLGQFDGSSFTSGSLTAPASAGASENLPVTPPQGTPPSTTDITMSRNADYRWLPVPSTVLGVSVGDAWRFDPGTATVFSATTNTQGLQYSARSAPNQPPGAQLAAAGKPSGDDLAGYMTVPSGIIPRAVKRLTQQITARARTDYQAALDIQRFFTTKSRFAYDTTIPPDDSPNALAHFLLHSRRGFCQQFATAMAVMARLRGIPARVAVGFTRGTKKADGSWMVTTHDAHAWPELWFQGFGWLQFEPTPRGDGQAVTPPYAKTSQGTGSGTQKNNQGPTPKSSATPRKVLPENQHPQPGAGGDPSGNTDVGGPGGKAATDYLRLAAWWLVVLLALGLLVPGIARAVARQRRWRLMDDPARAPIAAWAELRDSSIDLGAPWDDDRSPRQIAGSLLAALDATPPIQDAMRRLVNCEERSRYAPNPDPTCKTLKHDVSVIRTAARERCSRAQRGRALILPPSTLLTARAALTRATRRWESYRRALSGFRSAGRGQAADVAVRP